MTRPAGDGQALAARLAGLGADVVTAPMIEIAPPDDVAALDAVLRQVGTYRWIAFTSRNAVRAVASRLMALQLAIPPAVQIAAVGPTTAAALRDVGIPVHVVAPEGTAESLVHILGDQVRGDRVLVPQGDRARPDLAEGLRRAGAGVDTVIAYRTADSTGPLPTIGQGDIIALFSPSAAQRLVALAGRVTLQRAKIVCIGPTTAAAVRDLGLLPATVAAGRTVEAMVEAIAAAAGVRDD